MYGPGQPYVYDTIHATLFVLCLRQCCFGACRYGAGSTQLGRLILHHYGIPAEIDLSTAAEPTQETATAGDTAPATATAAVNGGVGACSLEDLLERMERRLQVSFYSYNYVPTNTSVHRGRGFKLNCLDARIHLLDRLGVRGLLVSAFQNSLSLTGRPNVGP